MKIKDVNFIGKILININEYDKDSFKELFLKYRYDKKYFRKCGEGINRIVYKFEGTDGNSYVVKHRKNKTFSNDKEIYEKQNQNESEINLFEFVPDDEAAKNLLAPVIINCSSNDCLVMKKAIPFEVNYDGRKDVVTEDLKEWIKEFKTFENRLIPFNNIFMACVMTNTDFKGFVEKLDILSSYGLDLEDLYLSNLGEINGELVIIDYGLLHFA